MTRRFKPTGVPIEVSNSGSIGVPVFIQDQTTAPLDLWFLERLNETTIAADTVIDAITFTATTGHGIAIGDIVEINNTTTFMQAEVTNVATDVITVDSPINHVYASGSALIISNADMNVLGTAGTPRVFSIRPEGGQSGDFTRIIATILDSSSMDYTTFGGISGGISNGCVLRLKLGDDDFYNLFNWKTNGDWAVRSFDALIETKTGGGAHSFLGRSTWASQGKRGVALRVDGDLLQEIQVLVRDNLIGLDRFRMVAQGHALQEI
jgi:hypothetical protein